MRVDIPWLLVLVKVLNLTNLLVQLVHADIRKQDFLERGDGFSQLHSYLRFQYVGECTFGIGSNLVVGFVVPRNLLLLGAYQTFNTWLGFLAVITATSLVFWLTYMSWATCCHRRVRWAKSLLFRTHSHVLFSGDDTSSGLLHSECNTGAPASSFCDRRLRRSIYEELDQFAEVICHTDAVVILELVEHRAVD
ncbi:hypothetical protein FBUS_11707 [Fasciolopsis buskii]|uniref:Uncharacterized protein n=1 Tax=Fasciolopsis buskii TaxID=27845 RepID=A0A8E0RJI9_9TREM|nr:hypothetical protein FBUS_03742 [Fasciolopsis buski]KAA0184572.1 hypothetical protein FBUS_03743 [Fasciolopsis buski]KAA0190504.1 hypothetical protein FBUS_11707 [Fasciolopsis buski]